mmetsp:Transcript_72941/g.159436  ORF Transcript_72941/g.159436 Transcript_72941/m.159436 type:complete len:531 (-) Transcript_72941:336-1928(-)
MSAQKRIVVQAMADPKSKWTWNGGYTECGSHKGYPCYKKDSDGQNVRYIFYHPSIQRWLIAETLPEKKGGFNFNAKSISNAISPELAEWESKKVQKMFEWKDRTEMGLFLDSEFLHQTSPSIIKPDSTKLSKDERDSLKGPFDWIPGRHLNCEEWKLFDSIEPQDLLQGGVGDCWLIAAMAALAEFPEEVKGLFVRDGLSCGDGKFVVKLYDHNEKRTKHITLDEFIPCRNSGCWWEDGDPVFSKPHGNELWCLMLEKAMAKMLGGYSELSGGFTSLAFRAFTGHEEQLLWGREAGGKWRKWNLVDMSWKDTSSEQRQPEDFLGYLRDCDRQNFLLSAGIITTTSQIEKKRADGLVEGHAYSLRHVVKISDDLTLLELRNPWGNDKEWNGDWSDSSNMWDRHPEVKAKLRPEVGPDGLFWMDWRDFSSIFGRVYVSTKAMRTGKEAAQHSDVAVDWTNYSAAPPKPAVRKHKHHHRPRQAVEEKDFQETENITTTVATIIRPTLTWSLLDIDPELHGQRSQKVTESHGKC